jgi:hypothetical protein
MQISGCMHLVLVPQELLVAVQLLLNLERSLALVQLSQRGHLDLVGDVSRSCSCKDDLPIRNQFLVAVQLAPRIPNLQKPPEEQIVNVSSLPLTAVPVMFRGINLILPTLRVLSHWVSMFLNLTGIP